MMPSNGPAAQAFYCFSVTIEITFNCLRSDFPSIDFVSFSFFRLSSSLVTLFLLYSMLIVANSIHDSIDRIDENAANEFDPFSILLSLTHSSTWDDGTGAFFPAVTRTNYQFLSINVTFELTSIKNSNLLDLSITYLLRLSLAGGGWRSTWLFFFFFESRFLL